MLISKLNDLQMILSVEETHQKCHIWISHEWHAVAPILSRYRSSRFAAIPSRWAGLTPSWSQWCQPCQKNRDSGAGTASSNCGSPNLTRSRRDTLRWASLSVCEDLVTRVFVVLPEAMLRWRQPHHSVTLSTARFLKWQFKPCQKPDYTETHVDRKGKLIRHQYFRIFSCSSERTAKCIIHFDFYTIFMHTLRVNTVAYP